MEPYRMLDLAQMREFLEKGQGVVVDVLPPEHFAARHLPGAVNACVYEVVFLDNLTDLAPDPLEPVALYGAGPQSQDCMAAAEKLARRGYAQVAVFPGGLTAWREAGLALEGADLQGEDPPHPVLLVEPREYRLVPEQSLARWVGRGYRSRHHGEVGFGEGHLDGRGLTGRAVVDMTTIRDLDLVGDQWHQVLEKHLHSDDFFFTQRFPRAEFLLLEATPIAGAAASQPNYRFRGRLELRGARGELEFPGHLRNVGQEGRELALMAHFDLDRTQWGVIYGSARFFQHLSYHLVLDRVSLDLRVVLA